MGYLGPISRNNVGSQVNYITSGNATDGITGWNLYNDAGASPVDGTGGTATITFARNTSSPLRAGADFLLTKPASNVQGQGVSYDFTIDTADLGQVLAISFDYELVSGAYAAGDVSIFVIQDPNGTPNVITPVGNLLESVSVGSTRKEFCFFRASTSVTTYRLCIHVASTSASAYILSLDSVYVGQIGSTFYSLNFIGSSTEPGNSEVGSARLYYDTALNKLRVSQNGAAYSDLGTGGGGGGMVYPSAGIAVSTGSAWGTSLSIVPVSSGGTGSNNGSITGTGALNFTTGGTNQSLTLSSGGTGNIILNGNRILVGASTSYVPTSRLQVSATGSTSDAAISVFRWSSSSSPAIVNLIASRGAAGSSSAAQIGDEVGRVNFAGSDGVNFGTTLAYVSAFADATASSGNTPGRLVFSTTASGSTSPTERLCIDSAGNVGIGTTNPQFRLDVSGPAASIARFTATGGTQVITFLSGGAYTSTQAQQLDFLFRDSTNVTNYVGSRIYAFRSANSESSYLAFYTTDTSASINERLRIDSAGNVGIGGTPTTKLEVFGTSGNVQLASTGNRISFTRNGANYLTASGASAIIAYECDNHQFYNGAGTQERLRIDSAGNVGIGTSSPSYRLDVVGPSSALARFSANGGTQTIIFSNPSSYSSSQANQIDFQFRDSLNADYTAGRIYSWRGASSEGAYMAFFTAQTSGGITERMRIDSIGNVGIGGQPGEKLDVYGAMRLSDASGNQTIYQTSTAGRVLITANNSNAVGSTAAMILRGSTHATNPGMVELWTGNTGRLFIDTSGNVGIGTTNPGAKLEVAGQVKITGGSPGAGKVLTSDASGLATWETPTGGSSSGPITTPITSYTGSTNYNITSTDSTVLLTANGGVITATLPSAVGIAGRQYTIKRTGSGAASYSVTTTASQTIDKAATFVISNSSTFLSVVTVQSDGSNWVVISKS